MQETRIQRSQTALRLRNPGCCKPRGSDSRLLNRNAGARPRPGMLAVAAGALLLAACANHIEFRDNAQPKIHREVARTSWKIQSDPIQENTSQVAVRVQRVDDGLEVTDNVVQRMEVYTPYSPLWEFVEIPAGAVALPLSVLMVVGDIVTLGMIPNDAKDRMVNYAFAGLNPLLNIEGGAITQRREYRDLGKQTVGDPDRVEKTWREALRGFTAKARFDEDRAIEFRAGEDEEEAMVDLLTLASTVDGPRPRFFIVTFDPPEDSPSVEHKDALPRDLARRIIDAAASQSMARQEWEDPRGVARCVQQLTRLGFDRNAAILEEEWIQANEGDRDGLQAFDKALREEPSEAEPAEAKPATTPPPGSPTAKEEPSQPSASGDRTP